MPPQPPKKKRARPTEPVHGLYEIPGLPLSEGPQSHRRNLTDKGEPVIIVLQPGEFQYVWEMLEGRARADHEKYRDMLPKVAVVAEQTVRAFRSAHAGVLRRLSRSNLKPKA